MKIIAGIVVVIFSLYGCGEETKGSSISHTNKKCSDFVTQGEAQKYFNDNGGNTKNNFDGLDNDHDGIACEELPKQAPSPVSQAPALPLPPTPVNACCKYCTKGKPCGDSCISSSKNCTKPSGCAC